MDENPDVSYEIDEDQVAAGFVSNGFGICVAPNIPILQSLNVKILPLVSPSWQRNFYMAMLKNVYHPPVVEAFKKYVIEQAQKEFDSAVETYNKNVEETNTEITELTDSLDDLKSDYEQAGGDATVPKAELQNEYDTAVVEGKYAGSTYESTVSELESAVESAQDTLDTLKEEQTALLALENGVVTADEDGTIAAVPYEAEDTLQSGTAFALYCDTQTIMISVEVPQENIAQVGVGDEVSVMIAGNRDGAVTGTVSSIASSATTGGSVSNVTYAVIISIDNSDGRLGSGSSATVTFQGEQEEKTE